MFWAHIRNKRLGVEFFHQVIFYPFYIADFACPDLRLVVEIDEPHHDHLDNKIYDDARTRYINSVGYQVLRFTELSLMENMQSILAQIEQYVPPKKRVSINLNRTGLRWYK